jgi:hypothetical protein
MVCGRIYWANLHKIRYKFSELLLMHQIHTKCRIECAEYDYDILIF